MCMTAKNNVFAQKQREADGKNARHCRSSDLFQCFRLWQCVSIHDVCTQNKSRAQQRKELLLCNEKQNSKETRTKRKSTSHQWNCHANYHRSI